MAGKKKSLNGWNYVADTRLKPKGRKWCLPSTCKYLLCVLTREAFHPCFGKKKQGKKKKKKKLFILWVFKKTEFLSVKLQFLTRCLCGKHSSDPPFRSLSKCRYMHAASECSPIPASSYLLSPYLALNVRYSFYFFFFLFCKMETEVSIRLNARFPFFVMFPLKTVWNEGISEMCVDGSYWR